MDRSNSFDRVTEDSALSTSMYHGESLFCDSSSSLADGCEVLDADSHASRLAAHSKANFLIPRLKAFLTDMFLIDMPILYFVTYFILDGKDDFLNNHTYIVFCEFLYCFFLFLFLFYKNQTPGFRYAEIAIASVDGCRPSAMQVVVFLFVWVLELGLVLPLVVYFVRRDRLSLHELLSKTRIIYSPHPGIS